MWKWTENKGYITLLFGFAEDWSYVIGMDESLIGKGILDWLC